MSIIITGASGQLGTSLQTVLDEKTLNSRIIMLDKTQLDVTNKQSIKNVFAEYKPKWVINAAAFTAVDAAETQHEAAFNLNVNAARYLAEECDRISAKLIHFSSDYVFSGDDNRAYVETDICAPKSTYGETKWLAEQAILTSFNQYIILRTSWLFSPFGNNFVKTVIRLLKEKDSLRIVSDQVGCPTSCIHLAKNVQALISQNPHLTGIFHYSDKPAVTWYDLACYVQNKLVENYEFIEKPIIPITTEQYPTPAIRPKYSVLNCEKILKLPGIKHYDWQIGVDETLGALFS